MQILDHEESPIARTCASRAIAAIAAMALLTGSAFAQTTVRWAGAFASASIGVISPTHAINAPDGNIASFNGAVSCDYSNFGSPLWNTINYGKTDLANLLGVSEDVIARADFIAFEINGYSTPFESCSWTFDDGSIQTTITHDNCSPALSFPFTIEPSVLSIQGISPIAYTTMFGFLSPIPSYVEALLFDLPGIDIDNPAFKATLTGGTGGCIPDSPDVDAMGTLVCPAPVCCPPILDNAPFPPFGPSNPGLAAAGVFDVVQVFGVPYPYLPPGYYYMTMTVNYTSGGQYDCLSGIWNCVTDDFVALPDVNALNDPFDSEAQCSISWDLRTVVCDSPLGVKISCRSPGLAYSLFPPPSYLTGLNTPVGYYVDPQLSKIDNQLVMFYRHPDGNLWCGEVDCGLHTISNLHLAVVVPPFSGVERFHSPTPIPDQTGECRGLIFSAVIPGVGVNAWYQSYPKPVSKPPCELFDPASGTLQNPMAVCGDAYYAHRVSGNYVDPLHLEFLSVSSDVLPAGGGGVAEFVMHRPTAAPPAIALLAFGPHMLPLTINTCALLCIDPQIILLAGLIDCELSVSVGVPTGLPAQTLCGQGATLQGGLICLSNTFVLELR